MKHLFFLLLMCAVIVAPVMGSQSTFTRIVGGSGGGVISHMQDSTEASGNDLGFITGGENFNGQYASHAIVTDGYTDLATKTIANNQFKNTLDTKVNLSTISNQAAISTSYAMVDNKANIPDESCTAGDSKAETLGASGINGTPVPGQFPSHQSVDVEAGGLVANGGQYFSQGVLNDANITVGVHGYATAGMFTANDNILAEAGFDKSTPTMNFQKESHSHSASFNTNKTVDYIEQSYSLNYKDFSNPFETIDNVTRMTKTGNETVELNSTVSNVTDLNLSATN